MNSTETDRQEALRRFHAEKLVPAAAALKARGVTFFERGGDPATQDSWYEAPPSGPAIQHFEAGDIAEAMTQLWQAQGLDELVALVPELLELAQGAASGEDPSDDVSPFLYMMY